jgi:hypothetical protein
MGCSVYFYAMNANQVAEQFRGQPDVLVNRMKQLLRDGGSDEEEIEECVEQAIAICGGELPDDCEMEYFFTFRWLIEGVSEEIEIGSFREFRSWFNFEEIAIWPWMTRTKPPFPVPVSDEPGAEVGFLSVEDIEQFALPAFKDLPPTDSPDVAYSREEFKEVLETLVQDKLDLVAVVM